MNSYKVLNKQNFTSGNYSIEPIRMEDRYDILKWRNEQVFHLRQNNLLTIEDQDKYFKNVINTLFNSDNPNQILFSFFKEDKFVGYGGLVHINWLDKNAEISFLMNTELEEDFFETFWVKFLSLIEMVAFENLNLHKIYTYAFDLRPKLYSALDKAAFKDVVELKQHSYINDKFISVKIHSKFNKYVKLRNANEGDLDTTYRWVNNSIVREFSFDKSIISKEEHSNWFRTKLRSSKCKYYILEVKGVRAGSIRFDIENIEAKISYLIDPEFMGQGLGTLILYKGIELLKVEKPELKSVYGLVFESNQASKRIFNKLNFSSSLFGSAELKYVKEL